MTLSLIVLSGMSAQAAEEPFQIIYRQDNVKESPDFFVSDVFINVYNATEEDATAVTVSIPEPNQLLNHSLPVVFGDIPHRHQKEVVEKVMSLKNHVTSDLRTLPVIFRIEYSSAGGERKIIELEGKKGI